jgi:2-oxoglutarate ferredoxin oxidoreductase subunit alpha
LIAEKRLRKHETIKKGLKDGLSIHGKGSVTLIGWGSTKGAIIEAQSILKSKGIKTRFIQVKLLSPLPLKKIQQSVKGKVIVIENNRDNQLASLLKGFDYKTINKYDGRPLHPEEIANKVRRLLK